MNDFTKEELGFILDGTRHWSNKNIPTPWVFEFKKKVESMIDSYCEHTENYICMGCLSATCEKCHKIWGLKDDNQ